MPTRRNHGGTFPASLRHLGRHPGKRLSQPAGLTRGRPAGLLCRHDRAAQAAFSCRRTRTRRSGGASREKEAVERPKEANGPKGPEPTRYGDWERNGIASDF